METERGLNWIESMHVCQFSLVYFKANFNNVQSKKKMRDINNNDDDDNNNNRNPIVQIWNLK